MPDNSSTLTRQGHRLVQLGVALFLFVTLQGLVIQNFAVPSLGRSAHTVSLSSGLVLLGIGLIWPRLTLGSMATRIAFWFLIYSLLATIVAFLLAAMWGAGTTVAAAGRRRIASARRCRRTSSLPFWCRRCRPASSPSR